MQVYMLTSISDTLLMSPSIVRAFSVAGKRLSKPSRHRNSKYPFAAANIQAASSMDNAPGFFTMMASGQLESAEIPGCQTAYCKFEVVAGEDWQILDGMDNGITQVARQSTGPCRLLIWNFPVDVTYKATNAFGWPQVVVSVYGVDAMGRDVIQGYGCIHLPTCAGRYNLRVRLYRPRSASLLQTFTSWLTGMPAEFSDPKFPSYGEGREVTRVVSSGHVNIQVNVLTKDMAAFGYSDGSNKDQSSSMPVQL